MSTSYFPEQLDFLSNVCKALNDAGYDADAYLQVDEVTIRDDSGKLVGFIRDEIGGAFGFYPHKPPGDTA